MKLYIADLEFDFPKFSGDEIIYQKGDFVFKEGEQKDGVFFVASGDIKIIQKKRVLWSAIKGELIGISSFFADGKEYRFSGKAAEKSTIIQISHQDFQSMLTANPSFSRAVIEMLCKRIKFTNERLKHILTRTTKHRLIDEIIRKATETNKNRISYTHEELSELIGISKRLASSFLIELEKKNLLKRSKDGIRIYDLKGLKFLANSSF